jgi:exopolyphosphatase/guanosine-5'-triphosphate,3'-diphosphate pyrophosphatase
MRICAIDIGSNSVRCLVADAEGPERLIPVARALEITRLGEGMGNQNALTAAAQERTIAAVEGFLAAAKHARADRFILLGTWALREASNAGAFVTALERRTGHTPRILSGEEEAALVYRGVTRTLLSAGSSALVIDIGGGSVELIAIAGGKAPALKSLPLGCVRMTERFLRSDPPLPGERDSLRSSAAQALSQAMTPPPPSPGALIGAGGTITTAAAILQGLTRYEPQRIHGSRLSREAVIALIESLARLPLAERERVPGLEEKRADIIVAGLIILQAIMEFYGAQELTVSDEGILHGAVMESIQP